MSLGGFRDQPVSERVDIDMQTFSRAHSLCMRNISQYLSPINMSLHPEAAMAWIQDLKHFVQRVEHDTQLAVLRKYEHRASSGKKVRELARSEAAHAEHAYAHAQGARFRPGQMYYNDGIDKRFMKGKKTVLPNDTSDLLKEEARKKMPKIGKRIYEISKEPSQAFNMEPLPADPHRKTHNNNKSVLFNEEFTNAKIDFPSNPHNKGASAVEFYDYHSPLPVDLSKNTSEKNAHVQKFWDFEDQAKLQREALQTIEKAKALRSNKNQQSNIDLRWHNDREIAAPNQRVPLHGPKSQLGGGLMPHKPDLSSRWGRNPNKIG
jgi:hypothetical protein